MKLGYGTMGVLAERSGYSLSYFKRIGRPNLTRLGRISYMHGRPGMFSDANTVDRVIKRARLLSEQTTFYLYASDAIEQNEFDDADRLEFKRITNTVILTGVRLSGNQHTTFEQAILTI